MSTIFLMNNTLHKGVMGMIYLRCNALPQEVLITILLMSNTFLQWGGGGDEFIFRCGCTVNTKFTEAILNSLLPVITYINHTRGVIYLPICITNKF